VSIELHARAVLVDMDGTLVDSTAVIERVWSEWAGRHALDPAEVLKVVHGRQSHESMAILLCPTELLEKTSPTVRQWLPDLSGVRITGDGSGFSVALPGPAQVRDCRDKPQHCTST
jgi:sugar-phosphatase